MPADTLEVSDGELFDVVGERSVALYGLSCRGFEGH